MNDQELWEWYAGQMLLHIEYLEDKTPSEDAVVAFMGATAMMRERNRLLGKSSRPWEEQVTSSGNSGVTDRWGKVL